jgi:RNA polymerase sigma-70 factor (ECF subfamily)
MIELRMNPPASQDLAVLYDRISRRLYGYALSLTGDPSRSEDAVHDAFVRLLQYAPGRDVKSLEGFLFTAARNLILDDRRRSALRRDLPPAPLPLAQPSGQPDEAASRALGRLPEEQREAVVLKIYGELTFAEIGEVTGASLDTAAARYRLGIEKLAQLLPRNES